MLAQLVGYELPCKRAGAAQKCTHLTEAAVASGLLPREVLREGLPAWAEEAVAAGIQGVRFWRGCGLRAPKEGRE